MATPRRVGVIGLGAIAQYYLTAIAELPEWQLGAVCDLRAHALPDIGAVRYQDHRRMLADEHLDAVVVTVPNDVHARVCIDALDAGLPVCVEKPLALTPEQARGITAAAGSGGVLFTAFHRRSNEHVLALRDETARRGGARQVRVRYLEQIEEHTGGENWYLDPQRCGGGCVADNGPNAFDLVRLFLGEVRVRDVAIDRDERGVDRQAHVRLESESGATAEVQLDWSYPGEVKDVRVEFADGSTASSDMLAGFPGFKSSLRHEYRGILHDFQHAIEHGHRDGGLPALELVADCYRADDAGAGVPRTEGAP